MASGHVKCRINRPDTWQHRPGVHHPQKTLANTEPSTHGTWQTSGDASADGRFRVQSGHRRLRVKASANDPKLSFVADCTSYGFADKATRAICLQCPI